MSTAPENSALIKTILHKSLAEGVFKDIVSRNSSYYYFLGKTLQWSIDDIPPYPIDSYNYEREVRSEIITFKQIKSSDVAFVIPRIDWVFGDVYDMYDDQYDNQLSGINVIDGGSGFTSAPTVTVTGGGGTGATCTAIINSQTGKIIDVVLVSRGIGYTSEPTVTFSGGNGSGAVLRAVLNISATGQQKLEDCSFYVLTDEFNVYKCLDNNNNSPSTIKPTGTQVEPIATSDGYVWKYMYNVPIALRNKFLTSDQIPVISALTTQFYSNGSLENVIINNNGKEYLSANIVVTGDGYRESDPTFIESVNIVTPGSGYTSATVVISDPVSDASSFVSNAAVFQGQRIFNSNKDFYEVVSSGTLGVSQPVHRSGVVRNGTAALKYIGTTATATATVEDGEVTAINLLGGVREVTIINSGSGYISTPSVTFSNGGGSGATGYAKMYNDTVGYVVITNSGSNYTSNPTVTFGQQWQPNTAYTLNQQVFYSNRLYTVTEAGTSGTTIPDHDTLNQAVTETDATVELTYVGQPATGEVVRRYGAGYQTVPLISVLGEETDEIEPADASFLTSKSEAKLLPIIEDEQIVGIITEDPGIGYTTATVTVNSSSGEGAELVPNLNIGNIESLQANNELLTVSGTIDAIKVISGGYGYGSANVIIVGDGTGATATATVNPSTGSITKINITNRGSGYTFANVIIYGNGSAAKARAIISPFGGHGKNAPDELFSRTLMFYSNVSTDLNQGLQVNNDYRQIGIIKNPKSYDSIAKFDRIVGSSCFIIEADINLEYFQQDMDLYLYRGTEWVENTSYSLNQQIYYGNNLYAVTLAGTSGSSSPSHTEGSTQNGTLVLQYVGSPKRRYRIVSLTSTSVLLQSLDNDVPLVNELLFNDDNRSFVVKTVGFPEVDKYSGQMMYIDNKQGFTPSEDETVILRTVIKF